MKGLITILVLFTYIHTVSAQFTVKTVAGDQIKEGDVLTFNNTGDDANLFIQITNTDSSPIDLVLSCDALNGTDGSDFEFCFGYCYFSISEGFVSPAKTIEAGETTLSNDVHFHNHDESSDVITYDFTISQTAKGGASLSFTYKYDKNYTSSFEADNSAQVYPNPADGFVYVDTDNFSGTKSFVLQDLSGRTVKNEILGKKAWVNIEDLTPGVYFYSTYADNAIIKSGKLIIVR